MDVLYRYIDFTLLNVLVGSMLLCAVAGLVGTFALLRREALLGDVLAHASLPGICLAYIVVGDKSLPFLLGGALLTALAAAGCHRVIVWATPLKEDAALGISLSVFYGAGIVLLTKIQGLGFGTQAGLKSFLFGSAATMLPSDVQFMTGLTLCVGILLAALLKELKLVTFDREFAVTIGYPVRFLDVLLTMMLAGVIVAGLRIAGVVLMVAATILPPAAARQWSNRLGSVLLLAALIGGASGAVGAYASAVSPWMKTGPTIVLVGSLWLGVSIILAPGRGLIARWLRERRARLRIEEDHLLRDLYLVCEEKSNFRATIGFVDLLGMRGWTPGQLRRVARRLIKRGLLRSEPEGLRLTERGADAARRVVLRHRLWETFLSKQLNLPADHLHRDAEAMEHVLDESLLKELEEQLGYPTLDPHGRRIPRVSDQ